MPGSKRGCEVVGIVSAAVGKRVFPAEKFHLDAPIFAIQRWIAGSIRQRVVAGAVIDHASQSIVQSVCIVESLASGILGQLLHGTMVRITSHAGVAEVADLIRSETLCRDGINSDFSGSQQIGGLSNVILETVCKSKRVGHIGVGKNTDRKRA